MVYYVTSDKAKLDELNSRGIPEGNVTRQWVEVVKHPLHEEWAACIPVSYLPRLGEILGDDAAEVSAGLLTREDMIADGWNIA